MQKPNLNLPLALLAAPFAVWRLASLLADTEQRGPFGVLAKLRHLAGVRFDERSQAYATPGSLGEGLLCVHCSSLWLGAFYTALISLSPIIAVWLGLPLALSACAIWIEQWIDHT